MYVCTGISLSDCLLSQLSLLSMIGLISKYIHCEGLQLLSNINFLFPGTDLEIFSLHKMIEEIFIT